MDARDHRDLGGQGADVARAPAVDAHALGQGAVTDDLLGQRLQGGRDLVAAPFEALSESLGDVLADGVGGVVAVLFARDPHRLGDPVGGQLLDGGVDVVLIVAEDGEVEGFLGQLRLQLGLGVTQGLDEGFRGLQALPDDLLGGGGPAGTHVLPRGLGATGLDHHDRDVPVGQDTPGDDHLERGPGDLLDGRETHPGLIDQGDANPTDGTGERQPGQGGGHGCGVDRDHVVVVGRVEGEDVDDHLHLVAQPLHEGRAQRAVDQSGGQNGALSGASLAAEEGAGDASRGVHPLLDVNGEREEVDGVPRGLCRGGGGQQHGVAVEIDRGRAVRLLSEDAGFETDGVSAVLAVVDDGFGEFETRSFHGQSWLLSVGWLPAGRGTPPVPPVFDRDPRGCNYPKVTTEDQVRPPGRQEIRCGD